MFRFDEARSLVAVSAPGWPLRSRRWWCEFGQVGESGHRNGARSVGSLDAGQAFVDLGSWPAAAFEDLEAAGERAGEDARMIPDWLGEHAENIDGVDQRITRSSSSCRVRRRGRAFRCG
jgi:hypothetical protein